MIRKYVLSFLFLVLVSPGTSASPQSGTDTCLELTVPFHALAQLTLEITDTEFLKVHLCHRVANAERHFQMERTKKSVDELRKYISDVQQSTPRHIDGANAEDLIAEAQQVISIILGDVVIGGTISGGVYDFQTSQPIGGASVTVSFTGSVQTYSTTTDGSGFFKLEDMPLTGAFLVDAVDDSGAVGSAQGSLLPSDSDASVLVVVDQPGSGLIQGQVSYQQSQQGGEVLVTAIFPDTKREHTAAADIDGNFRLDGLRLDGTVIVIAFDNNSGASASYSTALTPDNPVRTVDLELVVPAVINSELKNGNFADGLTGWTHSGPLQLVDRNLVFSVQN